MTADSPAPPVPAGLPAEPEDRHFLIAETAAKKLAVMADGNGLKADQIRLVRHDTGVHQIPGSLTVKLKPDVKITELKGNVPQGLVLGSKEDILSHIEAAAEELFKSADIQRDILKIVATDAGHGWGLKTIRIPLPSTAKDYSNIDKCLKCAGQGTLGCLDCNGSCIMQCQGCFGQGAAACTVCFGAGSFQKADGTRQTCLKCTGQGKIICAQCNGNKTIPCKQCDATGQVGCTHCSAKGYWTHVYHVVYTAMLEFDLDRSRIPEGVQAIVDTIGLRPLAEEHHAQIFSLPPETHEKSLTVPLVAFLPIAEVEFAIAGKSSPATVAGLQGYLIKMEPFLDPYVKPGINALLKLSKGGAATRALLQTAEKYRLVKNALSEISHLPRKTVYQHLIRDYPHILSDKYAKGLIKYASEALLAIGKGPRLRGLALGTAISALLAAAYYFSGIRGVLLTLLLERGQGQHILLCDMAIWLTGYTVTIAAIKVLAAKTVARLLPSEHKHFLQPAGDEGLYALFTTLIIWVSIAALAPIRPEWLISILKKLGI
jgi:hypothetical protein